MGCGNSLEEGQPVYCRGKTYKIDTRKQSSYISKIQENINEIKEPLTVQELQFLTTILTNHFMFKSLDEANIRIAANKFKKATAQINNYIFRQGDNATCFFILSEGQLQMQMNCNFVKMIDKGEPFGELALMYSACRSFSIKVASNNIKVYYLQQANFKSIMKSINTATTAQNRLVLQKIKIFNYLTNKQKYAIISNLVKVKYKAGVTIFSKQQQANCLYFIMKGSILIKMSNKSDIIVHQRQYFGESALNGIKTRVGTAISLTDAECLTIGSQIIEDSLGNSLNNIVYYNVEKWTLLRNEHFMNLSSKCINSILNILQIKKGQKYDVLRKKGLLIKDIIIPLDCKINQQNQSQLYGVSALQQDDLYKRETQDIVITEGGNYACGNIQKIQELLNSHSKKQINPDHLVISSQKTNKSGRKTFNLEVSIKNFIITKKLGQGQFGQVYLAKEKRFGSYFAVKKMCKQQIQKQQLLDAVIGQKQILQSLNSNFIEGYYKAEADRKFIYIVLQYIRGSQLFDVIREIGLLPQNICKYYIGSLTLAIEHLHNQNIIYRDIKPQNAIVSDKGQLVLIDLGTAKRLDAKNGLKTFTLIGTPHYMAPEIIEGKGYSLQTDYWSLGVIFYQFLFGKLPFGNTFEDPYEIFRESRKKSIEFPNFMKNTEAISLIKKLLDKNPLSRAKQGLQMIKQSSYFSNFNWTKLQNGQIQGPYIPKKFRNNPAQSEEQESGIKFNYDEKSLSLWDQKL